MTTPTAAITLTQIAALADLGPDFFARHREELPPSFPLHVQTVGRPQLCYSIDDVAALVAQRTAHLSEAVCRLRVALAMGGDMCRIVTDTAGRHHVVRDSEELADLPPDVRDALMRQIHADNAAASQRRTRRPIAQEQQP
ncbi:hypothetical protein HWD96_07870 [Pseudomonas putida]|uniref:hypothetical protein n=1 Tax=Pseudomonas putida TaxID=303 RepID=UPI001F52672E|nr:hypothetical protein [Pseudomonas putida]MCI1022146.1 hypothetical protein [Pseudomonas putida]